MGRIYLLKYYYLKKLKTFQNITHFCQGWSSCHKLWDTRFHEIWDTRYETRCTPAMYILFFQRFVLKFFLTRKVQSFFF